MWAVTFDPVGLETTGDPVLVVGDVMMDHSIAPNLAHFAVSKNGTLAYLSGGAPHGNTLVWVSADGEVEPITNVAREHFGPRVSPDGRQVAVRMADEQGRMHIWTYDLVRDSWARLTGEKEGWWPVWSSDGSRLSYSRIDGDRVSLVSLPLDGSRPDEPLTSTPAGFTDQAYSWSSDGGELLFQRSDFGLTRGFDIWMLQTREPGGPRVFLETDEWELHPAVSPSGRFLANAATQAGGPTDENDATTCTLGGFTDSSADGGFRRMEV